MCKLFLQQRCRFGNNCRMSQGFSIPISSLKQYVPTVWDRSLLGSSILANSGGHSNIWRKAELMSWDGIHQDAQVVFQDEPMLSLSISECAQMSSGESDEEPDSSSSESLASSDKEDGSEDWTNVGFMETAALQRGVQTETAIFAK